MGFLDDLTAIFYRQISFFLNEDIEGAKRLLETNGIWTSAVAYVTPGDGSTPGAVVNVKRSQYQAALQVLRGAGIL